ncbi:phosphoesterase [Halorarum halophilum]|uniref:Phosphoesterase n=1 Tax=Halorarum halophilum TaxID=2743090 RepID=A0A7D5GY78_9EURY|nr:SPFH domain-containing protein [Halobaculum halophilum]QLG28349.1 phosphoesterase [Halobaculum halophilum]
MDQPGRAFFRELGRLSAAPAAITRPDAGPSRLAFAALVAVVALLLGVVSPVYAVGFLLAALVLATAVSAVEIVQAYERRALTVFGGYRGLLDPGLHIVPPFVSRTYRFDLRTITIDVPRQEAITRDNSPVTADAVVYVRVVDAKRAFLQVDDYRNATALLAQTTLRAVLGDMELDDTLSRRSEINARIREGLQGPTDDWGVEVEMVEVREVLPTPVVRGAMEEQTSAERRRRAMILEAQGERRAAVESAEGDRVSNVLTAQGEKQASVLEAQGDAVATVLRARAAESMGERAIVDKGLDALVDVGRGESTTFVLPQELTSLVGRYGRRLSGSDVATGRALEGRDFDDEERELLGLDDIGSIVGNGEVETTTVVEGDDASRGR